MDAKEFRAYQNQFVTNARAMLVENSQNQQLSEAALPAYSDKNPLIRFLFWRRIQLVTRYLKAMGPYEAVLDFGCGSGVMMPLLAEFTNRVVGLDVDLAAYNFLSEKLSFPENLEACKTSEKPIASFGDETFDCILAMDVLEHVDDLAGIFKEFKRICKPKATIIVSGPTENLIYKIGRMVAGKVYTGDYHVTNIYEVHEVMKKFMPTETLASLYQPLPLFKIFVGHI